MFVPKMRIITYNSFYLFRFFFFQSEFVLSHDFCASHCGCVFAVVPSLLVCLCSGVCEVRRAAIAVLHSLSGVVSSPYYPLVENLLKSSEEIIADPSYLKQVSQSTIQHPGCGKRNLSYTLYFCCVSSGRCHS